MTKNLDQLRSEIDTIDDQIVNLLNQRMTVTDEVGAWKKKNQMSTHQENREIALINRLKSKSPHIILKDSIEKIYKQILIASKTSQQLHVTEKCTYHNIGIVGMGLIGGSIAKAVKTLDTTVVISVFQRSDSDKRYDNSIVSHIVSEWDRFVYTNDLIIIATPISSVVTTAQTIAKHTKNRNNKLIVIDVASTKSEIASMFATLTNSSVEFLATHPMAGSEKTGYDHSNAGIFVGNPWIITPHPHNSPDTIQSIRLFTSSLGAHSELLTPEAHDGRVASISHLTFMIASYLVKYIADKRPETTKLAGTGFLSTTRVASGSVQMHTEIYDQNHKNILFELQCLLEYIKSHPLSSDNVNEFFTSAKHSRDNIRL